MAVAYRSSQSVTNGTAGTTVVVTKPAGIVDTGSNPGRDHLIAMISCTGAPTITPPAGWTLVATVASGSSVTLACYRKLPSSEGASWTWGLGTSQRNWGWVGAYTGVDPDDPVYAAVYDSETDNTLDSSTILNVGADIHPGGVVVVGSAASRVASGSATTWVLTSSVVTPTERADVSTNGGAGTDIAGVVGDRAWLGSYVAFTTAVSTASQTQAAGVSAMFSLRPYFVPYGGGALTGLVVEAAFGADADGDQSLWTWTDVTESVLHDGEVNIVAGRANGTNRADPSRIAFTVLNLNGEWTSPTGAHTQYLVRNLPFRVRISGGFGVGTTDGYHLATAYLATAKPRWDATTRWAVVDIVAQGMLRRLQQGLQPSHSAAYRRLIGLGSSSFTPVAYWALEDESAATSAASPLPTCPPAAVANLTFGGSSVFPGSAPVAILSASSTIVGTIPGYPTVGTWCIGVALTLPSEPAAATCLIQMATTGTARAWQLTVTPGASTLDIRAFDATGVSILTSSVALTEASVYGQPVYWGLQVTQSGANISYESICVTVSGDSYIGVGSSGSLAGYTHGQLVNFSVPAQPGLAGAGMGHVVAYADLAFVMGSDLLARGGTVVTANAGEWPWSRFQRLTGEDGVASTFRQSDNTDLKMGPQLVATLLALLNECEIVEGCVLTDSGVDLPTGTGLLDFPAREERDNRTVDLTLDVAASQVMVGFEPILDDQNIRNDVEVSRPGGSSARVTDEASIARDGLYRDQVTANTQTDLYLGDIAGLRLALGTIAGMRYPYVGWDLRRSPDLAEQWLACAIGARVDITNPPTQYPPDDIESFLEGYTQTVSTYKWQVRANLSPAGANHVAVLADDTGDDDEWLGRLAGDPDAAIRADITSTATTILVDPNRTRFTTLILRDSFTRTTSNGWGTPDLGPAWSVNAGTAAGFSTNGTLAIQSHPTIANRSIVIDAGNPEQDITILFRLPVAPTGGTVAAIVDIRGRRVDDNNSYYVRISTNAAGTMAFTLNKVVAAAGATLATGTSLTLDTAAAYGIRLSIVGSAVKAKFWNNNTAPEPAAWQLTVTDTALVTGNTVDVFSIPLNATNPLPFDFYFDQFSVTGGNGNPDDFDPDIRMRLGMETIDVSSITTTPGTYVAAGTTAHADNASVTPALPAGVAAGDLLLILTAIRSSGTGRVTTPTGYTRLPVFAATDNVQLFGKVHSGSESAPTVNFTLGSAGDTTSAQMAALRGTPVTLADLADIVVDSAAILNAAAQNIAYPGVWPRAQEGCIVLVLGWKQDDNTSVATLTGFTEIGEMSSTTGNDQSLIWDYQIQTTPAVVNEGSFVVTGGGAAISRGAVVALAAGYQTFTCSARSVNSVVKAQTAGTKIEVDDPGLLGM